MSEAEISSVATQTNPSSTATAKFWRIAFKVTSESYKFKKYDLLKLNADDYNLFEQEIFTHCRFYDLCRTKGVYKRFHEDFVQCYYADLFIDSPFHVGVFIFVEEVMMSQGHFVKSPHALRGSSLKTAKKAVTHNQIFSGNAIRDLDGVVNQSDYEVFYLDSPSASLTGNSINEQFVNVCSEFIRGHKSQRGNYLIKNNAFACFSDGLGLSFIKFSNFIGLVPNLKSSSSMLPLALITALALAHKHNLLKGNKILSEALGDRFSNSRKLSRRIKKNMQELTFIYRGIEQYLNSCFLSASINFKNTITYELYQEIITQLRIQESYDQVQHQLNTSHQTIMQLSMLELSKSQSSISFNILLLGFIMLMAVVIVCSILGIEPLIRMLSDLGLISPELLQEQSILPKMNGV